MHIYTWRKTSPTHPLILPLIVLNELGPSTQLWET